MDRDIFIEHLTTALRAITTPRFYETERGFQGELLVGLHRAIPQGFLPERVIIEQEYHLMTVRQNVPSVAVHEPSRPIATCARCRSGPLNFQFNSRQKRPNWKKVTRFRCAVHGDSAVAGARRGP
jgi:hypothetical protein